MYFNITNESPQRIQGKGCVSLSSKVDGYGKEGVGYGRELRYTSEGTVHQTIRDVSSK
jgi:hypothetical protein